MPINSKEELSDAARALIEGNRVAPEEGHGPGPLGTPENGNIRVLGGSLSLGLIEDEGINKPALVMSVQYATLLSDKDMEAIMGTMGQMRNGIEIARSVPEKMSMIKGGRVH